MKRLLSGLAVTVLIVAGVGAAIILLSSRDGGSLDEGGAASSPAGTTAAAAAGATEAGCTRDGNVVAKFNAEADGIRIDRLAERLGAINTAPARAAGQAIIAKEKAGLDGVTALTSCQEQQRFASATDPAFEAFVRQYLGNKEPASS